jgi:hypothetical protein
VEIIATIDQFARADAKGYTLSGLTPDDSPLASLLRSQDEIYALDLDIQQKTAFAGEPLR